MPHKLSSIANVHNSLFFAYNYPQLNNGGVTQTDKGDLTNRHKIESGSGVPQIPLKWKGYLFSPTRLPQRMCSTKSQYKLDVLLRSTPFFPGECTERAITSKNLISGGCRRGFFYSAQYIFTWVTVGYILVKFVLSDILNNLAHKKYYTKMCTICCHMVAIRIS